MPDPVPDGWARLADGRLAATRGGRTYLARGSAPWDGAELTDTEATEAIADGPLGCPAVGSGAIYCVGANYGDHVEAALEVIHAMGIAPGTAPARKPMFFLKPPRAALAPPDAVVAPPPDCAWFDPEVELAVVIGRPMRDVAPADALGHVLGYAVAIDLSARDFQIDPAPMIKFDLFNGKVFEGSCPLGPVIVPAAAVPDPHALAMRLTVNGHVWQDGSTAGMLMDVPAALAALSRIVTLHPGDVVLTGTPAGTGLETGRRLAPGDDIAATIEGLGTLRVRAGPG